MMSIAYGLSRGICGGFECPHKEIVWFEHSGHSPWVNERDMFIEEVLSCLLENKTQR